MTKYYDKQPATLPKTLPTGTLFKFEEHTWVSHSDYKLNGTHYSGKGFTKRHGFIVLDRPSNIGQFRPSEVVWTTVPIEDFEPVTVPEPVVDMCPCGQKARFVSFNAPGDWDIPNRCGDCRMIEEYPL